VRWQVAVWQRVFAIWWLERTTLTCSLPSARAVGVAVWWNHDSNLAGT
jgi:hypothetical protein